MTDRPQPDRDPPRVDCWRCGTRHYTTGAEPRECVLCGAPWGTPREDRR